MRRHLIPTLANVHRDNTVGVDGVPLIRIDDHAEETRVGVDQLGDVSGLQVPEDGCLVQVSHVGNVIKLFHLGWIDLKIHFITSCILKIFFRSGGSLELFMSRHIICKNVKIDR